VNTLRLYNVNPTTHLYVKKYLNVDPDIKVEVGPQHRPFLDKALEYGFKVIFPILNDEATIRNNPIDKYSQNPITLSFSRVLRIVISLCVIE
jgi:hypothetical protein